MDFVNTLTTVMIDLVKCAWSIIAFSLTIAILLSTTKSITKRK